VDKILEILKAAGFQAKQAGGKTASEIAIPDSDLSAR
jgi:hypothetical protein